jgi:hypothetical protein
MLIPYNNAVALLVVAPFGTARLKVSGVYSTLLVFVLKRRVEVEYQSEINSAQLHGI